MWKKIIKSKTLIFGFIVTVLGAAQTNLPYVQAILDPVTYGILTALIGVAVVVLRFMTTTSVSDKE